MIRTRRVRVPSDQRVKVSFNHAGNNASPSSFSIANLGDLMGQGNYLILLGPDEIPDTNDPDWPTTQELGWMQPVGSPREIHLYGDEEVWAICAPVADGQPATHIYVSVMQTKVSQGPYPIAPDPVV